MRRIIALLLTFSLILAGCGQEAQSPNTGDAEKTNEVSVVDDNLGDKTYNFSSLGDPDLLQQIEDNIYSDLEAQLASEDYIIESIDAIYISKEYIEELEANSRSNIYFGYTLDEIESQFADAKYIFTCNEEGKTVVTTYETYEDDTYGQVVKNVAIGSGVILICVTVSAVGGAAGATVVSEVFAASASTGTKFALSTGVISGAASAFISGIQTGDVEQTIEAATLSASDGFKWGAISGVIAGGAGKVLPIRKAGKTKDSIPSPKESETYARAVFGGEEQISYLDGKVVPFNTSNATRPDVVIKKGKGAVEAIEVKNYDLTKSANKSELYSVLERQVSSRVKNLPKGSTQKIVLDTRGRNYSKKLISDVIKQIQERLADVYPNIPVVVL